MNTETFIEQSKPFIGWMLNWKAGLKAATFDSLVPNADPHTVGIISVDVIEGFCTIGPLSSARVNGIVEPITALLTLAWERGVRDICLPQDTHPADAVEFAQYAPHCIQGTAESETVAAFKKLPFFDQITVIEKNCINCGTNDPFLAWVKAREHIKTWIVVGDCTDICTYQLAMHLRTSANERQIQGQRIILPVDCVDTYDLPVDTALKIGATPHDGELLHHVFLYHMMLNGVEVVTKITA
ncbi:MAG: isochorismatase family protein [Anaerolineae bacterium]|nr:isochorismatase family protein [Anaerolineae bacterium]